MKQLFSFFCILLCGTCVKAKRNSLDTLATVYGILNQCQIPSLSQDTSFGTNGSLPVNNSAYPTTSADGYYVQSDGAFLVFGSVKDSGGSTYPMIGKFLGNGSLDTTFGSNGWTIITANTPGVASQASNGIFSLAEDGQGGYYAAGLTQNTTNTYATVWHILQNGTVDTQFGSSGYYASSGLAGGTVDYAYDIKFDAPSNMLYFSGSTAPSTTEMDLGVWSIDSQGKSNTSFNGSGFLSLQTQSGRYVSGYSIQILSDRILISGADGADSINTSGNLGLWAFDKNGQRFQGFGQTTTGETLVSLLPKDGSPAPTTADAYSLPWVSGVSSTSQDILLGGQVQNSSNSQYIPSTWRFHSEGYPDKTFGNQGIESFGYSNTSVEISGIQEASGCPGGFYAVGYLPGSGAQNSVTFYRPDGRPSDSFGTNGTLKGDSVTNFKEAIRGHRIVDGNGNVYLGAKDSSGNASLSRFSP